MALKNQGSGFHIRHPMGQTFSHGEGALDGFACQGIDMAVATSFVE